MRLRSYFDVRATDRSDLGGQVAAQRRRVIERLGSVRHLVAVLSGKGGVGKSYLTAALAAGAAGRVPNRVGVLDADLTSPTVAGLLAASGPLQVTAEGVHPARGTRDIRVISTDLLLDDGQPLRWREPATDAFVWRGAMETAALREFLSDIVWGPLDLLLVDLPPGADAVVDLRGLVPAPKLTGAIAVTIPTDESRRSVSRTMRCALDHGVPLLGIVENMSGYRCTRCGEVAPLFPGDAGAALAQEFAVPLLARVPFGPAHLPEVDALVDAFLAGLL